MDPRQPYETAHEDYIRRNAAECTLFLKRDEKFPLDAPCEIALIGAGARNTIKGGTGSGDVNSRHFTTCYEGLKRAGFTILSDAWLDAVDEQNAKEAAEHMAELKARIDACGIAGLLGAFGTVRKPPVYDCNVEFACDTGIYVLARNSGEGGDRSVTEGDMLLSEDEIRDIRAMNRFYKRFLLVLNVGGMVDLSPIADEVANILLLSQLGVPTGDVLADILLGHANPSGKLAMSWADAEDYPSIGNFGGRDDTNYAEDIYVGYRYFSTTGKKPLFPFGYGLSYTTFALLAGDFRANRNKISLSYSLTNTGTMKGKEVVQLYVTKPEGKLPEPALELLSYRKSEELAPGEKAEAHFDFDVRELSSYDERTAAYILQKGDYVLSIGNSSDNLTPCGIVRIADTLQVRKVRNIGGTCGFMPQKYERQSASVADDLTVIRIESADIPFERVEYEGHEDISSELTSWSDDELAHLLVGAYTEGFRYYKGENWPFTVVGAVGETTLSLRGGRLNRSLVMSDGPAGLRIDLNYGEDEDGRYALPGQFSGYLDLLPKDVAEKFGYGGEKRERHGSVHEQSCTAIPIGTAIAQSFNDTFAEGLGDLAGDEMERFGIHLWLAPALNIQRDPRCGRNFEYYSEDPVVSGRIAAAITRGVQKHKGCGATIKHCCCNNQETNRMASSSNVSERALREIYLKGFEIAVREGDPLALMTSYNLLNGVHTSERRDLVYDFLHCECGFRGVIMTDWISDGGEPDPEQGYRHEHIAEGVAAGNDLFMQGSQSDVDQLLKALKEGRVSRKRLEIAGTRVLRLINKLNDEREASK